MKALQMRPSNCYWPSQRGQFRKEMSFFKKRTFPQNCCYYFQYCTAARVASKTKNGPTSTSRTVLYCNCNVGPTILRESLPGKCRSLIGRFAQTQTFLQRCVPCHVSHTNLCMCNVRTLRALCVKHPEGVLRLQVPTLGSLRRGVSRKKGR